jgi:hypothetical protein
MSRVLSLTLYNKKCATSGWSNMAREMGMEGRETEERERVGKGMVRD